MRIDHKLQRIQVDSFEISDELVYRFFISLPENERETALLRAIRIGVLATMEDRFSAFLSKTTDDLGVQLENLKLLFDMKQEIFHKTAIKGVAAENDILEFLETYIDNFHLGDVVSLSGTSKGLLKNNKTGDILAYVGGENSGKKVAIECKFDKSIKLGDVDSLDIASNKYDTAWSQLLETTVNRGANTSIIVFDKTLADASIQRAVDGVSYIDNIGFICIIDYEATSSIDTRTERIIQESMDRLMHGRTTFVIAHRLSTVRNSDCIMVLEQGRIIERGTHDQLISEKGKYYQLYTGNAIAE